MIYNKPPKNLGIINCDVEEYFSYTYLPIKLAGQSELTLEKRLHCFNKIIGRVACDFVGDFGLDRFVASNIYLTAKHQYQRKNHGFNRPGWHSDGFGTDDVSYIWYNKQPTIFNSTEFSLCEDDEFSMQQMKYQADESLNYTFENNSVLRMDQFTIHRVAEYEGGNRAFLKICFSLDEYRLKGNSINHELNYKWEYLERKTERNIPQLKS